MDWEVSGTGVHNVEYQKINGELCYYKNGEPK